MEATRKTLVFISHNKQDKEIAREIGLFLTSENINVWFDEWIISAGESITEQINQGLMDSTHFIILWSKNSSKSNWVKRELNSTICSSIKNGGNPKILPIVIDGTTLPPLLNDILYIKYLGGIEKDRKEIVRAVIGEPPSNNYIRAIVKKYNEVIINEESSDPLPFIFCPRCGSSSLEKNTQTDYRYDTYYFINCLECNWIEWTQ